MRCWSSTSSQRKRAVGVTLLALGLAGSVLADDLEVASVSSRVVNDIYVVDADVRYGLSPDMRDALDNGITLAFDVEVEIRQPRRYLWDQLVTRSVQRLRLEYHALSRTYVVSNDTTRTRQSFPSLDQALLELGHMRGAAISETRHLPENGGYTGRIRVRLDVDALPAPLRPIAYLSPDWHLSSTWRQWEVKP